MKNEEEKIGSFCLKEYLQEVEEFHGHIAPGLVVGGFMVEMAKRHIPKGVLFDAISETSQCLPDAIQILTPCTVGNSWLRVIDLGRFALALFDKYTGEGVRVFLDAAKLEPFPAIRSWFFRTRPKAAQDEEKLLDEIKAAGEEILGVERVRIRDELIGKQSKGKIALCPVCGEAYPASQGDMCSGCQGQAPYLSDS
ncbi:MAG: formylmethanofuran dehydrogenase subunit E family protein [Deltaproteobacteria bacterium]|nr:formylmethanofuran dehydrogenase subunit E family protein [Deltaproteobacteria bacterium]MBW1936164.1 formylmethanofuran dehydrogenase subunit E family protein [Deltaproteobacteria bacterium]MBW1979157.1 formylmethanofuran dehydrogenase subunit E family protein [Deltaproteobacteria bacterium]MBW2299074.1 formylmethanofuran dehydrogenase subunit E family protein [Deltaproteobacteria bacterium]RLB33353.1 MAG: hypothetical protein DRH11_09160 [Deltaproteobacteria bacterium]